MNKRISLIEGKYDSLRIPVYIQSFSRGADAPAEGAACLSLQNYFDGRFLKSDFRWNKDILPMVEDFLCTETNPAKAYNLHFDAHSSIAFAAGRTLDSKSGISIMPVQKIKTGEHQLWNFEESKPIEYPKWKYNDVRISDDYFDTALVIGAAVDISYAVEQYLEEAKIPIGRIIYCSLDAAGSSEFKIQNGEHAWLLAQELYRYTARRSTVERRATIHVFSAAPNALMFFLGRLSRSWGKCILYEYDFEQKRNCTYLPSITFGIEE